MKSGTPIERAFICVLTDGTVAVDWGDGRFQDLLTGEVRPTASDPFAHTATDDELESLVRQGLATGYDVQYAYLHSLPDQPRQTLD